MLERRKNFVEVFCNAIFIKVIQSRRWHLITNKYFILIVTSCQKVVCATPYGVQLQDFMVHLKYAISVLQFDDNDNYHR